MPLNVVVCLTVKGAAEAIAFYQKAFDAKVNMQMPTEDKKRVMHADLTIHGDVAALFRLDMKDFAIAAIPSARVWLDRPDRKREEAHDHMKALGMTPPYRFFNTGVMVIDPNRWAAEELGERALAFLRKNSELCLVSSLCPPRPLR